MKGLLPATLVLAIGIVLCHGQGTVLFQNITPVNAPVYNEGGVTGTTANRLQGTAFRAQLWASAPGGALTAIGASVPFLTGSSGAGFFIGGSRVIDAVAPGGPADIQVRVWQVDCGVIANTWDEAVARGRGFASSPTLRINQIGGAGEPPAPPVQLTGLQSFTFLTCVPEPSTTGLAIMGALGALVLIRRRK